MALLLRMPLLPFLQLCSFAVTFLAIDPQLISGKMLLISAVPRDPQLPTTINDLTQQADLQPSLTYVCPHLPVKIVTWAS